MPSGIYRRMKNTELLTVEEVALRTGRSANTVRRWEREGKIRAVRVLGRLRFLQADVEALLRPQASTRSNHTSS